MKISSNLSTERYRWVALVFLSLGLAIVIIDNTVLNVAIPYILRDLKTSFDAIQWVISGYALIIATLLITIGRIGDLIGRRKLFILGCACFAFGSFIASVSWNAKILFLGEAFIEAIGAAMMLTSSLSLLAGEFHGKERAIAFGIWGSVAGASATIGPLLGGYLTANYSWRWSLRINVVVALMAIMGTIFIKESKGEGEKRFDWLGTFFSGIGLFSLVFVFIEGEKYGWLKPNQLFTILGWVWPFASFSVIPVAFMIALIALGLFIRNEYMLEKKGESPLMKLTMFRSKGFSLGLVTLGIVMLGQFGAFFILPIYLQNVLGFDALQTGIVFLPTSLTIFIIGPLSGYIVSKIGPKWIITTGMFLSTIGMTMLRFGLTQSASEWSLVQGLIMFGMGIGMTSAQLTNLILSSAPPHLSGEASAVNSTVRQIGTSIGIAVIGAVLSGSLMSSIMQTISSDTIIPPPFKSTIIHSLQHASIESGQKGVLPFPSQRLSEAVRHDVNQSIVTASKKALLLGSVFIFIGALVSLFIPNVKMTSWEKRRKIASNRQ